MNQGFTYEEVLEAYIKLKTYIYYDSNNLFLRKQLTIFETNPIKITDLFGVNNIYGFPKNETVVNSDNGAIQLYERKLDVLTKALNEHHKNNSFFEFFLSKITAKFLPKKIEDKTKRLKIISNKRTQDEYYIQRSSVFIDAPIEIHIISVLWILREGVRIDHKLFTNCLGNRLILNNRRNKVVQGSGLFKPYPKQYQKWRDNAVSAAKESLEKDNNVALLNLDIRDFFYSVRIQEKTFLDWKKTDYTNLFQAYNNLIDIFQQIHKVFTKMVASKYNTPYDFSEEVIFEDKVSHYILPIGLLSSFIIANDYLKKFDNRIISKYRPKYYGRYVDDILIVIENPLIAEDNIDEIEELNFDFASYHALLKKSKYHDATESLSEQEFSKLNDLENFILKNFHPILTLIDSPSFLNNGLSQDERIFKINGYNRLYCQSDKTLLYYFDKKESSLVIDKLKRDLDEKSSEFRNYDDIDEDENFEESAYHLLYDGTDGKIRTLKDYKEDKFGLSVYLSKKIFKALRKADNISDNEAEKLIKFFQGANTLNLYTLWEKTFAFFLVHNKPSTYIKFYFNCREAIDRIKLNNVPMKIPEDEYKRHLYEYLECAFELTLSLHPNFIKNNIDVLRTYEFLSNEYQGQSELFEQIGILGGSNFITKYSKANLGRHHYMAQPLINYTKDSKYLKNYTSLKLPF